MAGVNISGQCACSAAGESVGWLPYSLSIDQITCYPSSQTLCSAAVGKAWSLLGSPRNGQSALYLFQKHLLCWEYIRSFSHCGRFWNRYKTSHGLTAALSFLYALPFHPSAKRQASYVTKVHYFRLSNVTLWNQSAKNVATCQYLELKLEIHPTFDVKLSLY
jgi:hypothetical protein